VLFRLKSSDLQVDLTAPRHYCRNPHCRGKLKAPVSISRNAFCCDKCRSGFYRIRCVVCEEPLTRKTEGQRVCRRPKCRAEFRRDRARFLGNLPHGGPAADISPKKSTISAAKSRVKPGRAWRVIAGPHVPGANLAVPLEPELADRLHRFHAGLYREAGQPARFQRGTWPATGSAASALLMTETETAASSVEVTTALIATIPIDLTIPEFLRRSAAPRPAAESAGRRHARRRPAHQVALEK
jgi:hypothetical protein